MEVYKNFNNYSISDYEAMKVIYENKKVVKLIKNKSFAFGKQDEDLEALIVFNIYKTITKNKK